MSNTNHFERVSVETGGIRIPACPECGAPNIIPRKLERATFGKCAGDDCEAWLAYDVSVVVKSYDNRESAKYAFETHIESDD